MVRWQPTLFEPKTALFLTKGIDMRIGDKVVMNGKYKVPEGENNRIWTVDSLPWATATEKVVRLKEYGGYYPVNGLEEVLGEEK